MRCRGFDGVYRTLAHWHSRPSDIAAFVIIVGCAAAIATWDTLGR